MIPLRLVATLVLIVATRGGPTSCRAGLRKCLAALDKGQECPMVPSPRQISQPGPEGFRITELRPGVYSWDDGVYWSLILYKGRRLTVIDFPNGASSFRNGTYLLNEAVVKILGNTRPVRLDMVYGHRHRDHIGGAEAFSEFIREHYPSLKTYVWGTIDTRSFLALDEMSTLPTVNAIVGNKGRIIKLSSGLSVNLFILGGHSQSDLAAHIPPSRDGAGIMHFADMVTPGFVPFLSFSKTIDLGRYVAAQEELLKFPFKIFSPGHGGLGGAEDIRVNIKYTRDVVKFMKEAAKEVTEEDLLKAGVGAFTDPSSPLLGNAGFVVETTIDLQASFCLRKLIEKYGCYLANVDLFGHSHCTEAYFFDIF